MALSVIVLLGFNAFVAMGIALHPARLMGALRAMSEETYSPAQSEQAAATFAGASALMVLLAAVTGPLFLAWLWQAHRVASARHPRPRRFPRRMVVGAWLLPGPNLWLPPRIVRDVWLGSGRILPLAERRRSAVVVTAWWICLCAGSAVQAASTFASAATLDHARALATLRWAGAATVSLAAVLGMLVVHRIARLQGIRD